MQDEQVNSVREEAYAEPHWFATSRLYWEAMLDSVDRPDLAAAAAPPVEEAKTAPEEVMTLRCLVLTRSLSTLPWRQSICLRLTFWPRKR